MFAVVLAHLASVQSVMGTVPEPAPATGTSAANPSDNQRSTDAAVTHLLTDNHNGDLLTLGNRQTFLTNLLQLSGQTIITIHII